MDKAELVDLIEKYDVPETALHKMRQLGFR